MELSAGYSSIGRAVIWPLEVLWQQVVDAVAKAGFAETKAPNVNSADHIKQHHEVVSSDCGCCRLGSGACPSWPTSVRPLASLEWSVRWMTGVRDAFSANSAINIAPIHLAQPKVVLAILAQELEIFNAVKFGISIRTTLTE